MSKQKSPLYLIGNVSFIDRKIEEYKYYPANSHFTAFLILQCMFNSAPHEGIRCLDDFGMEHYSKSGFRWKVSKMDPWWRLLNAEVKATLFLVIHVRQSGEFWCSQILFVVVDSNLLTKLSKLRTEIQFQIYVLYSASVLRRKWVFYFLFWIYNEDKLM